MSPCHRCHLAAMLADGARRLPAFRGLVPAAMPLSAQSIAGSTLNDGYVWD